jgi:hypothetical protein
MNHFTALVIALVMFCASGCATSERRIDLDEERLGNIPISVVNDVPFIEQTPKLCGPTALYMVTKARKPSLKLEEVTQITFTPEARGTFKQDMLSAARRMGMAPYKVRTVRKMFDVLASGSPVVIFHRTEFMWKDYWHYSVLTGYDRKNSKFYVHIGSYSHRVMDVGEIVRSWEDGGSWAYIFVEPKHIPEHATFQEVLENDQALLRLGFNDDAFELSKGIQKQIKSMKRLPSSNER